MQESGERLLARCSLESRNSTAICRFCVCINSGGSKHVDLAISLGFQRLAKLLRSHGWRAPLNCRRYFSQAGRCMRSSAPSSKPIYRGSSKHKNRPTNEQKGTLCPEWTHTTPDGGFGTDVHAHNWAGTEAAALFATAWVDVATGRRYATARGVAFEAKPTADGTWHGYPIPWESVPAGLRKKWIASGAAKRRQIKAFFKFEKSDIYWALNTDDR